MIKTKEKSISQIDKKDKIKSSSRINPNKEKNNNEDDSQTSPRKKAIEKIEHTEEATTFEAGRRSKNYVIVKVKQRRNRKGDSTIDNSKQVLSSDNDTRKITGRKIKPKAFENKTNQNFKQVFDTSNYIQRFRNLTMNKYQKKLQNMRYVNNGINRLFNVFNHTFSFIKKATTGVSNLVGAGVGFIVLICIVLFIGIFACLSDDSTVNSATEPISAEVIEYRDTITKYAKQYEMEEYVTLIQAVMMNESEGKGKDPMQSSMFEYNKEYPRKKNGITNTEYSIDVGVHFLSDCFKLAEVKGPYDMENISLMLQGYNYGLDYIKWAKAHFGGYTRANAKVYSDEKRNELQVETFGDPKYVSHVLRYYHLGNSDIVMVAKTQIGNVGGKPYWSWYGFNERVEWCACFVSWVANESGQLNVTIPKFAAVSDGIKWYKEKGLWHTSSYMPKPSDLIFFDWEQDGISDHVGIIQRVENGKVYTIEGNSNDDECREKSYSLNSNVIFGYGELAKR